jgi:subfamily B ATP-binding cassette protein MsbA
LEIIEMLDSNRKRKTPESKPGRHSFTHLLSFAKPYWWQLVIVLFATFLISGLQMLYPAILGKVIDSVLARDLTGLKHLIYLLLGLTAIVTVISLGQVLLSLTLSEKVVIDLRTTLYEHLLKLPLRFFHEHHSGELISRLTNDVSTIRTAITSNITGMLRNLITVLFGVALLLIGPDLILTQVRRFNLTIPTTDTSNLLPVLGMVALFFVPGLLLALLTGGFQRRQSKREYELLATTIEAAKEAISNAKIVKAFTREEHELRRYHRLTELQFAQTKKRIYLSSFVQTLSGALVWAGLIAFLWYSGIAILHGTLTLGALLMVIFYFMTLISPLIGIFTNYNQLQVALGASERAFELLEQPISIADAPNAAPLPPVQGEIRFEKVTFGYIPEQPVLQELTFEVQPGKMVALVGPSGAGKTTITNLIPRFFDIQSGRITIDGHDIRDVQLKTLREQISMVQQEPVLFNTTIRDNIAYGRLNATQEEIEAAAQAANAAEFIEQLPDAYYTVVGEDGVKLSAGQRQRIAIARAILRNTPILILDEATSALDNESERLVQEALARLMKERTTLVIAHRLSTVMHADTILVIDKGQIVEQGTHQELIARSGLYYRLYTTNLEGDLYNIPTTPIPERNESIFDQPDKYLPLSIEGCTTLIQNRFPELEIHHVTPVPLGTDNTTIEINDELIFRVPRSPDTIEQLLIEMRLLPALETALSVQVPHFEYVWPGNPLACGGYRKIRGVPLSEKKITPELLASLVPDLTTFFNQLHSFSPERAMELGVLGGDPQWWRQLYQQRYQPIRECVFPLLPPEIRQRARQLWERFLTDDENFLFEPVLLHCDVRKEHIIYDDIKQRVAGVIDWGDVIIGDPARDFMDLATQFGYNFVAALLEEYSGIIDNRFWQRLHFYQQYDPYSAALWALQDQNEARLMECLAQIEAAISDVTIESVN